MNGSEEMFANPYWHSLATEHAGVALGAGLALQFPADVIPFAGVRTPDEAGMNALRDLLAPGDLTYVTGERLAAVEGLEETTVLPGWQMHVEAGAIDRAVNVPADSAVMVRELFAEDAAAMVGLTDVAFPGYFRARTYVLGRYFGIEMDGVLVAMAGERLALPGYREISAVCTHPAHTGKGYAAVLIRHLMGVHAESGLRSFLHVLQSNVRAIGLYERLGYQKTRAVVFHGLRRA